jgi:hypothetical protein
MPTIIWTPEGSDRMTGTVQIERPTKPLTRDQYRAALSEQIDRMVAEAGPEEARALLERTVETFEGLTVAANPAQAGDVMVFESEELQNRAGMNGLTWPIPPEKMRRDLDVTAEMLANRTLHQFLMELYPDAK